MSQPQLLERTMAAMVALDVPQSVAWTRAYLASGADRQPLVQRLALTRLPRGQRPAQSRDRPVPARGLREEPGLRPRPAAARLRAAHGGHRKYGDFLECGRRFGKAMGVGSLA